MDNAEPYDLVTVLSRLEDLNGMARGVGCHSTNGPSVAAADAERTDLAKNACIAPVMANRAGEMTMSGRFNWTQISSRDRMRRQGVEDKGKIPLVGQPPKIRLKLSKAEAAAAFLAWRAETAKDKK